MAFTATPTDGSTPAIPMSSVVPDGTNTPLALEGGPSVTTGGNTIAPASMYVKDGNDVTLGLTTQTKATDGSTTAWTVIQLLKGILDKVLNTLAVTQSGTWTVQPGNTANTTAWKVDGSGVTQPVSGTFWQATQPVSGSMTANQGGTWTVQPGNTANTTPWLTTPQAGTSGAATPFHLISATSDNATVVKASGGTVWGLDFANVNASVRFIKLYDKATAPVSTDTPVKTIEVPANGQFSRAFPVGIGFTSGIGIRATTGMANSDAGTVGAGDLSIDLDYK